MEPRDSFSDFLEDISEGFAKDEHQRALYEGIEIQGEAEEFDISRRIREVRESRGLSIDDLALRTGLTHEYLESVERDEVQPALGDVVKIAKALDMKMGYLISGKEDRGYTVVRAHEATQISRHPSQRQKRHGYVYYSLAPHKKDRHMEPFIVILNPSEEAQERSTHDGQEFIYVLEGEMGVYLEQEYLVLKEGDAIYYDSTVPHLVRCHGSNPTRILAVLYTER